MPDEELAFKPQTGFDPEIIPKPKQLYNLTWLEYASKNYQQIVKNRSSSGTIFEVPAGFDFYLTSLWCSVQHSSQGVARISTEEFGEVILLSAESIANTSNSNSLSFNPPLKFRAGGVISHNAVGTSYAGCCGFLVAHN